MRLISEAGACKLRTSSWTRVCLTYRPELFRVFLYSLEVNYAGHKQSFLFMRLFDGMKHTQLKERRFLIRAN